MGPQPVPLQLALRLVRYHHLVSLWRLREDGSSITQRRHELADLRDRVVSKSMSTDLVRQAALPVLDEVWYRDVLPVDMWEYFRAAVSSDDDYWHTLRSARSSTCRRSSPPAPRQVHTPLLLSYTIGPLYGHPAGQLILSAWRRPERPSSSRDYCDAPKRAVHQA